MNFLRVAAASALSQPAAVISNCIEIIECIEDCRSRGVQLLVLPKLSLSAATCGDLFFDEALLEQVRTGLTDIIKMTKNMLVIVGLPVRTAEDHKVYNAAAVINDRELIGLVHAGKILNYSVFGAWNANSVSDEESFEVMGVDMVHCHSCKISCKVKGMTGKTDILISFADEEGMPDPDIFKHEVHINCILGAVPSNAGMSDRMKKVLKAAGMWSRSACIFSNASAMESSTDHVFEGELCITELDEILCENVQSFEKILVADIDLGKISAAKHRGAPKEPVYYEKIPEAEIKTERKISDIQREFRSLPYLPKGEEEKKACLADILRLQYRGLSKRLKAAGIEKAILGMSGGLDSTTALISTVNTFQRMGLDTRNITALMLPCFGSSDRTKNNALALCEALNITYKTIDIKASVVQHFIDIGHDEKVLNATFENAQARERTQVLMDMANDIGALVIGTSDMSEIALGFSTYGGDHIAMYGMNNSLPKTVLQELIRFMADIYREKGEEKTADLLTDVYHTPISPELLPPKDNEIVQKTEDIIGPYELHDFFLYYFLKYRYSPRDIFELALYVFQKKYQREDLLRYLKIFYKRFFSAQFKRSCSYDAPVLLGLSLSPRGGFQMPSDAAVQLWLSEIERLENEK